MKNKNKILISLVASTLLSVSLYGACSAEVAMGTNKITGLGDPTAAQDAATKNYVDTQISGGGTSITAPAGYGVIYKGQRAWLDRNLGATAVANAWNDRTAETPGDLYQWGRDADGHQSRTSATDPVNTACSTRDNSPSANFILTSVSPFNWRTTATGCTGEASRTHLWSSPGTLNNGVCPAGWRVPSEHDFASLEIESVQDAFTKINLSGSGYRNHSTGSIYNLGTGGYYWTSTIAGDRSRFLRMDSTSSYFRSDPRAYGFSVRCVKHLVN